MRYRLMASYLGASYQAAVGPSDRDVTLFAAPPPPEEHGFSPVPGGGIWRKQVRLDDLDGLWESRPIGSYHGEPCLVLDDLGDRLHIVYLGMDERRAGQLGYWQVDRGVFEVVVQRHEVTDLAEERHEFPIALLLSALPRASAPRALNAGDGGGSEGSGSDLGPGSGSRAGADAGNGGSMAGRMALASGGQSTGAQRPGGSGAGTGQVPNGMPIASGGQSAGGGQSALGGPVGVGGIAAWNGQPATAGAYQLPTAGPQPSQLATQPSMAPSAPRPQVQTQTAQQAMTQPGMPPQFTGGTATAAQQATVASQPANAQPANAQPPAAVVAWHGSPVPDGNGTWYYQPNIDPQAAGGISQNGISQNVLPQNLVPQNGLRAGGYGPAEQGTPAAAQSNGLTAAPQFAQRVQPAPGTGYQQAAPVQQTVPPQPTAAGQQLAQAAAPPAPQFQQPGAAPAALPDAGPSVSTPTAPGGTAGPVNLGMPLSGPLPPTSAPSPAEAPPRPAPAGPLGRLTGAASAVRGRRAARKPRLAMSAIFADLVDMADVPRSSYAVDEEVTGAMCLFKTDGGYEVFSCAEDARHEVRFFEDEEAAYFYLFGVLAAEALRNGRLTPRRG